MSKKRILLLGTVIVLMLAGFILGQAVNAAVGSPGAESDPLVTKSYIDSEVEKLQSQINALKGEVEKIKSMI